MMYLKTDILIVGGGIAGLSVAISISEKKPDFKILLITKNEVHNSSTNYAQGGIASSPPIKEKIENHIQDTLVAGNFTNDRDTVKFVIENSHRALSFLKKNNVVFDQDLLLEGGHSENRIHHHKDSTGNEIEDKLVQKVKSLKNVEILENFFAFDLTTENNTCFGVKAFSKNENKLFNILASKTVLATGGLGQMYSQTTNPTPSLGDGISIAIKNNVKVRDIDLVQFHPTAIYLEGENENNFLISETVRGSGGFLENINGERFMKKYDDRGDLAPRDIVSISIFNEMKRTKSNCVFLNISEIKNFETTFPKIYSELKKINIKNKIPVVPTAHYLCGGIVVDLNSQTSMKSLFAIGECTYSGLHGSNRLASNSLLEAVVFAITSSDKILSNVQKNSFDIKREDEFKIIYSKNEIIPKLKSKLKNTMQKYMGVQKSNDSIKTAKKEILKIEKLFYDNSKDVTLEFLELENMIILAKAMVIESENRTKNTGVFFNKDLDI